MIADVVGLLFVLPVIAAFWAMGEPSGLPVRRSQSLSMPAESEVATNLPPGPNATAVTVAS